MSQSPKSVSRRRFLTRCIQGAASGGSLYSSLGLLNASTALAAPGEDYRALVCVFLYGGNDSFNMVVPRSAEQYNEYAAVRQNLAVPKDALLPITPRTSDGADYGLHPSMPEVQSLFDSDSLAIIANVGALIEPVTRAQFTNRSVELPDQLFSHNSQQAFWHALRDNATQGWAGRMADMLEDSGVEGFPINLSMDGNNLWQTGVDTTLFAVDPRGRGASLSQIDPDSRDPRKRDRTAAFQMLLNNPDMGLFAREYAKIQDRAITLNQEVNAALLQAPELTTIFPSSSPISSALKTVARVIASREILGQSRQIFLVGYGGWDTHADQDARHPALLRGLSQGLSAFADALGELGVRDHVTTFTGSDFGRTLTTNGRGSDHGWGGVQLVMGGEVLGGDIYGAMPALALDGPEDSGRGRIIPSTPIDEFAATLARWYGTPESAIGEIFPNLTHFDSTDLGFMV